MSPSIPPAPLIVGYQSWQKLAFIHWRVSVKDLQPLIPRGLTIEQFDGSAWLGVVPFSMERIRPWWSPPVPGVSWFLETNVRTYIVDEHGVSGVWFFTLDANKKLAVSVARTFWHLPYKLATMALETSQPDSESLNMSTVSYRGVRRDHPPAEYQIKLTLDESTPRPAVTGTLDHWLTERYLLFAQRRNGTLMTGRVHHAPYQIQPVVQYNINQTLTAAIGCPIPADRAPDHLVFSPGVDVRVSPLRRHGSHSAIGSSAATR